MCDLTKIPKDDDRADPVLTMYRESHAAVARYTVEKDEITYGGKSVASPVESGLTWDAARTLRDRLNAERPEKRFGSPVYIIQLENSDEARAAMRKASAAYWNRVQGAA